MALQTQNLVMVGLGILKDTPPNPVQPPLKDGIHLRWAFRRQLGFPWHGFYLFRRLHRDAPPICLSNAIGALQKGPLLSNQLNTPRGGISSDRNLFLTNDFPASNIVEFDLAGRKSLRFTLPPSEAAYQVELRIGFRDKAEIEVMALSDTTPVARALVTGKSGDVVVVTQAFDAITSVKIGTGPAALIDLCYAPVSRDATRGWEAVPNFPYPLCLPVTHRDYPCSGNAPVNRAAAEALALGRVIYGPPVAWAGAPFSGLHEQLIKLVVGGPAGIPMADRSTPVAGVPVPPDPGLIPPRMLRQHPLDLVLFGTLHPAIAQMVGLYWADQKVEPGVPFDYLILADYTGELGGKLDDALKFLFTFGFANVDGYIVFNKRMASAPALAAAKGLRAYALPGAIVRTQDGGTQDASNNAGLRWDRGVFKLGTEVLLPDRALMYHLWRADLGDAEQPAAPSASAYKLLTEKRPILVAEPRLPPGKSPQRSLDWPPFPLHAIDGKLREGWYSYRVSGIDIFGRHSPNSNPGQWFEWAPAPKPPPWYYQDPPGNREIHPFAVRLLDKIPPPPPTDIEAYALDPADPTVLKDNAYNTWWTSLTASPWYQALTQQQKQNLIALRVRWLWTHAHMRQAPDTREFRIYFHPGTNLPVPDHSLSADWQERYNVVSFDEHVMVTTDATGRPLRKYEVFLPADDDDFRDGLPLLPSPAEPITYAHIGVSAADDKTHTLDDPKWASGRWGGRFGNEGRVGAPTKIFRVLRTPPAPPVSTPDAERIFATPADYHSRSYYTYRWRPTAHLKTHIFRALDDALFKVDWSQRPRPSLSAAQRQFFPDPVAEPRWNAAKRQQVANELNSLNGLSHDEAGTAQAMARYRALSNDALRVLAGLTGNERAFTQLTIQPLDPDDPANANRIGPDNPPGFVVDPALGAYIDTLDGRSTNRYFYRAAYVDGAHNRSPLGLSSAPVYLPDVISPAQPKLLKVLGGDRRVTLQWRANQESALRQYHIYRTENKSKGRDIRLMGAPVATLPATPLVTQGGEVDFGPGTDVVIVEKVYAADGFNPAADLLSGQNAQEYLATPVAATGTRATGLTAPNGTPVVLVYRDSRGGVQYTPWRNGPRVWVDEGLVGARIYYYRIVATREGETASGKVTLSSLPSDLGAGRAVDLVPPDPPAWTRAEWIRVDVEGNEFPFSDPIPPGETREPVIALAWTPEQPVQATLIQQRNDREPNWTNVTDWVSPDTTSYIVRGLWPHVRYRFRLNVLSQAGNRNKTFRIVRVNPAIVS